MDKRRVLESYRANKQLVERNKKRIDDMQFTEVPTIEGKVKGSSREFPYIEQRFTVQMEDPVEADRKKKRIKTLLKEIEKAEKEIAEAEDFLGEITKLDDRNIFRMYFFDGDEKISQRAISGIVHCERSSISKIINKYL